MKKMNRKLKTERGLIWGKYSFESRESAKKAGFGLAFFSTDENVELYSNPIDECGYKHIYAIIEK